MESLLLEETVPAALARQWLAQLEECDWADARMSAGRWARPAKRSKAAEGTVAREVQQSILELVVGDCRISSATIPHRVTTPTILKYEAGDRYGLHEDNAMQGNMRADISYTLWLSGPDEYGGGDLCVGEHRTPYRPTSGSLLLYVAGRRHEVLEVTSGARVVAVGWIQSLVRDEACRDLLTKMDAALSSLLERGGEVDADLAALNHVRNELLRRWVEI